MRRHAFTLSITLGLFLPFLFSSKMLSRATAATKKKFGAWLSFQFLLMRRTYDASLFLWGATKYEKRAVLRVPELTSILEAAIERYRSRIRLQHVYFLNIFEEKEEINWVDRKRNLQDESRGHVGVRIVSLRFLRCVFLTRLFPIEWGFSFCT